MRNRLLSIALLSMLSGAAYANDSVAELGTGGIALARSDVISMDSEDLFISRDAVEVTYSFTNRSAEDVDTLVAFPMPDIVSGLDENVAIPNDSGDNFLGFSVEANGQDIEPTLQQRALAGGLDVTDELRKFGIPLFQWNDAVNPPLAALPAEVVTDFVARGILRQDMWDDGSGMQSHILPAWTLNSIYWWRMVFPAGETVEVTHRYTPSLGGTAGSVFYSGVDEAFLKQIGYLDRYCLDKSFLNAVKRKQEQAGDSGLLEERLSYVLRTGANWAGSIGRFHLTVDKGSPDTLVSFCGSGVKKTGDTTFEMEIEDFYPEADLNFLFISPADN